jgi:membrane fusion protein (multidrug efflux system)
MSALLCAVLSAGGCNRHGDSSAEAAALPETFPVTSPQVKTVNVVREYVADIRAIRHAELRSRLRGILESVGVDEGQTVKAGQTLFTINARARKEDLAVARAATVGATAELEAAQLDLQNTQLLADKNVVSTAELARAKSKVALMRAKLEETKAAEARAAVEVDRAQIRAPFDGVVNRVPHKAGSAVGEDELLTTITDTREVLAYFSLTEAEYLKYVKTPSGAAARRASLRLADGTMFPSKGEVDAVGSEIDSETGTITFRARFANPDGVLKHGSSGKVVLETALHDAVLVPQKSTFEVQGDYYVYAVDTHNRAHAQKIRVKARVDDAFAVESGLAPTDRFVVEGVQKLKDGMKLEVRVPAATPPGSRG